MIFKDINSRIDTSWLTQRPIIKDPHELLLS